MLHSSDHNDVNYATSPRSVRSHLPRLRNIINDRAIEARDAYTAVGEVQLPGIQELPGESGELRPRDAYTAVGEVQLPGIQELPEESSELRPRDAYTAVGEVQLPGIQKLDGRTGSIEGREA